jgi:hypothetical protein
MAEFGATKRMDNNGNPVVCTAESDQKPPVSEKFPPVNALLALASGWPMVPLTEKFPPLLVPPPPLTLNQSIEYCAVAAKVTSVSRAMRICFFMASFNSEFVNQNGSSCTVTQKLSEPSVVVPVRADNESVCVPAATPVFTIVFGTNARCVVAALA